MDCYFTITDDAVKRYKSNIISHLHKIELLDHNECVVGTITDKLCMSATNTISVNFNQGVRRSCNISIVDDNATYTPSRDSPFYFNRKFRILTGLICGDHIEWQSNGIFYCKSVDEANGILTVVGVDKFGLLNGELNVKTLSTAFTTDILSGDIYVSEIINEILMMSIGNGQPLDPVAPIIDPMFRNAVLIYDITLTAGQHISDLLFALADMFGANVFYDVHGRLNFVRKCNYNIPSYYDHIGTTYNFEENDRLIISLSKNYNFDCVNCVIVTTDNTDGEIYTYTAKNKNAQSPVNVGAVGEHYPAQPVQYISLGDTSISSGEEKCREYAEFYLMQNVIFAITENFVSPIINFLDVEQVVEIYGQKYLINSINIDLSAGTMQTSVSNIAFLPTNNTIISYI